MLENKSVQDGFHWTQAASKAVARTLTPFSIDYPRFEGGDGKGLRRDLRTTVINLNLGRSRNGLKAKK